MSTLILLKTIVVQIAIQLYTVQKEKCKFAVIRTNGRSITRLQIVTELTQRYLLQFTFTHNHFTFNQTKNKLSFFSS